MAVATGHIRNQPKFVDRKSPSFNSKSHHDGYDSDSSEEGRQAFPSQTLGLRVINADFSDDEESDDNLTPNNSKRPPFLTNTTDTSVGQQQRPVSPSSPSSETDFRAIYQAPSNTSPSSPRSLGQALDDKATASNPLYDHHLRNAVNKEESVSLQTNAHPVSRSSSNAYLEEANLSVRTSTQIATDYANQNNSKYAKVSYHLTNDPTALKKYREMATKTNDPSTQLMFAKYLLETANAFYSLHDPHAPPRVVGSKWGIGTVGKNAKRPEPNILVPGPFDKQDPLLSTSSSVGSKQQNKATEGRSHLSSINVTSPTSIGTSTFKQQIAIQSDHRHLPKESAISEDQIKKRNALEEEGISWIKRLAKQQVPEACYMQASWMEKEVYGFKSNREKSFALYAIAAKDNLPEALFAIADYLENDPSKQAEETSTILKFYNTAADKGYVNAIYKLAMIVLQGKLGVKQSTVEGLRWMHKACAFSNQEFHQPLYTFGLMLINEYPYMDIPSSLTEPYGGKEAAIIYLQKAAEYNNDQAQAVLGSIYEHGLHGESMNFARAYDYYEAGALNGNPKAMLGLSRLNNRGSHGPADKDEGSRLENDISGWLAATPANEDLAFSWCQKAAQKELPDALALLGWFYECGFGTPRDFSKAEMYYQLAAEKGDKGARSRLKSTNTSVTKQQHEGIKNNSLPTPPAARQKRPPQPVKKKNDCYCM